MKFHLSSVLLAITVAIANLSISNYTTKAVNCKDYEFLFARGSGSSLGADNESAWRTSLENELKNTDLTYNFYELGEKTYDGASYPAIAIGFDSLGTIINTASITLSATNVGIFNDSVNEGATEALGRIKSTANSCPNTKFILGGYSQGAMVITRTLKQLTKNTPLAKKLAYAATFGDPNLYLPEGEGLFPDACRGKNFSRYRIYAPNCRAHAGLLGANKPYEPSEIFAGKVGLWCTKKDILCSNYVDFTNLVGDHLNYKSTGIYSDAAKHIVKKLAKNHKTSIKSQDIAFLIDTTRSMEDTIAFYKDSAHSLAEKVLNSGGRVALYEYRDQLKNAFEPRKILDFGASLADFDTALARLSPSSGDDTPESALTACLAAMNELNWKKNSLKSIVLLSDANFHDPDHNNITVSDIVARSLEIDPVSIYPVIEPDFADAYTELAEKTGGKVFSLGDDLSLPVKYLSNRPEISLALEEYSGRPGTEFTFTALSDGENLTYDWDLDLDGEFEYIDVGPEITHTYSSEIQGHIQVRATNPDGESSTMSAKLSITNSTETPPVVTNLRLTPTSEGTTDLTFDATSALTALSIDETPIALTSAKNLTLSDLAPGAVLALTPISASGLKGETKFITYSSENSETNSENSRNSESPKTPDKQTLVEIITKSAHSKLQTKNSILPPKCGQG